MSECLENEAGSTLVLKRVTGTRWCAQADATKASWRLQQLPEGFVDHCRRCGTKARDNSRRCEHHCPWSPDPDDIIAHGHLILMSS